MTSRRVEEAKKRQNNYKLEADTVSESKNRVSATRKKVEYCKKVLEIESQLCYNKLNYFINTKHEVTSC